MRIFYGPVHKEDYKGFKIVISGDDAKTRFTTIISKSVDEAVAKKAVFSVLGNHNYNSIEDALHDAYKTADHFFSMNELYEAYELHEANLKAEAEASQLEGRD